ncbi:hypothetical protein [Shigella boydii]|uniref:hypothetical protein n=1 Tax=Shigella boydii TaxID=621 RepID=UPI002541C946|nr:hypothetical protein [Shigella boydii]
MFSLGRLTLVADTPTNHHEDKSMTKEQANQLLAQIVTLTAKLTRRRTRNHRHSNPHRRSPRHPQQQTHSQ